MKLKVRNLIFMLVVLVVLLVKGSFVLADFPAIIIDDLGNKVIVESKPERIISLAPNLTEMLFFLGLGDQVIGVTSFADYPEEAMTKEKIGTITDPNLEKIITLEPDLIIAAGINKKETVIKMKEMGLNVAGFNPQKIDDIFLVFKKLGMITGKEQAASTIIRETYSKLDKISDLVVERINEQGRPKVFYEIWSEPLFTAGQGTFIDDVITMAGGDNIGALAKGAWPQFSLEKLILENPDIYVSSPHSAPHPVTAELIKERPNFQEMKAVKNDQVYIIDQNIISRPSPRIVDGLKDFVKIIFPELAQEVDEM